MSVTGIGSNYVSPYGAEALNGQNSQIYNPSTGEMKPDAYVVRRHMKKNNTGAIIGNILLTAAAAFGIYKGRGHIKTAFQALKKGANAAVGYIKEQGIKNGIKKTAGNVVTTVKTGAATLKEKAAGAFTAVKEKVTAAPIGETIKTGAAKVVEGLKTIPEKLSSLVQKFHK